MITSTILHRGVSDISIIATTILAGLTAVTAGCPWFAPWEAIIIGVIGALLAVGTMYGLNAAHIDDPVAAIPVHLVSAGWGTIAVGICGRENIAGLLKVRILPAIPAISVLVQGRNGLFYSGSFDLLFAQLFGLVVIGAWSAFCTILIFLLLRYSFTRCTAKKDSSAPNSYSDGSAWLECRRKTNY